jgi:hypothetical protein
MLGKYFGRSRPNTRLASVSASGPPFLEQTQLLKDLLGGCHTDSMQAQVPPLHSQAPL